jgi:lipoprotein-anchoring transpeptidase ErfK/SrfK
MRATGFSSAAAFAVLTMLSACVTTGPAPVVDAGPVIAAPEPVVAETAYLATNDGAFTVPEVPLDQLAEPLRRQIVDFPTEEAPGTIIINTAERRLYFVTGNNQALRYGIAVGRDGFIWSGVANITERKPWPTWTPPPEMIERRPELERFAEGQPGGPENPLGARALYLTTNGVDYGYRIHGTPEWKSIGSNASSGCIRMINQDVMDLYSRVPDGAKVIVMNPDGTMPTSLTLPPPQPKKDKPRKSTPRAAVAPTVVEPVMPALPTPPPLDPELMATVPTAPAVVAPAPAAVVTPAPITPAPVAVVSAPLVVAPAVTAPLLPAPPAVAPAVTAPAATTPVCLPTEANPCPAP